MENEIVIETPKNSKITTFKNEVAREVVATLVVVVAITAAKFVGAKVTQKFSKRHKQVIETTATEQ